MGVPTQSRPNRFLAGCADCGEPVPVGEGDLNSVTGQVRHVGTCPAKPRAKRARRKKVEQPELLFEDAETE